MDEYVGNDFPAMPLCAEARSSVDRYPPEGRGQALMIDIAYVPTMCNQCATRRASRRR
jgi:hypothetical protein